MRFGLVSIVSALVALSVMGCDENKEKELVAKVTDSGAKPAPSAPAAPAVSGASAGAKPSKKTYTCGAGPEVDFHGNAALETEVRRKLGKDGGTVLMSELKTIKSINLSQATVDDLDPCIFPLFTGIKDLFLGPGDLDDLKPLAGLTQLITLRASINKVSDLTPLSKMTQMDRLDIGRTGVRDIAPLANMQALTELQLDDTQVTDLSPLKSCKNLEKVSIRNTPVKDLSPLKDSRKLRFVYIEGAPIEDTNVLAPLTNGGLKIVRKGS
jgi:internalin A